MKQQSLFKVAFQITLGVIFACVLGVVIIVSLLGLVSYIGDRSSYKTSENHEKPAEQSSSLSAPSLTQQELYQINLKNTFVDTNESVVSDGKSTYYERGTLVNNTDKTLYKVSLKLKLYVNNKTETGYVDCLQPPDDMQYTTIRFKNGVSPNDSIAFAAPVETSLSLSKWTSGSCAELFSAAGL